MKVLMRILILCILMINSCSRIFAPDGYDSDKNWQVAESEHFIFFFRENSFAEQHIDSIKTIEELAYQHIVRSLSLNYQGMISIYIYDSPQDAGWDKIKAMAFPRTETVEAIFSLTGKSIGVKGTTCHEIAHVITWNALGEPGTQFLSEGIAVAMDGEWHSRADTTTSLHQWAKKFMQEGKLPSLITLVNNWEDVPGTISYPVSGSFVKFLLEKYGAEKLKQLFFKATPDDFFRNFKIIYGQPMTDIEQIWKMTIQGEK